jgi:hypothetical protein
MRFFPRRSLLRGLGLGTATLFGRSMVRDARAQGTNNPLKIGRLLVLCMPNCSVKDQWAPRGGRDALATTGTAEMFDFNFCRRICPPRSVRRSAYGRHRRRAG